MKLIDLTGQRFGKWTVIEWDKDKHKWKVVCDCGSVYYHKGDTLRSGNTKQCTKCKSIIIGNKNSTHRMTQTPLYHVHQTMLARCYRKTNGKYYRYGARGIKVCEEWHDFINFYNWATTNGYQQGLTIDRINNDGNYEPSNCRWVTRKQNSNNTSANRVITFKGISKNLIEWAKDTGIKRETIAYRLNKGWSVERALTEKAFVGKNQMFLNGVV